MHLIDKCIITIKEDNSLMVKSYGYDDQSNQVVQLVGDKSNLDCLVSTTEETVFQNLKVYPSPADEVIHVELPQIEEEISIKIVSTDGRVLIEKMVAGKSNFSINIADLPVGIYFLEAMGTKEYGRTKVVKE